MDFVGPSVDIVNCIGPPICRYLKYYMKVGENMEILRRKLEELNCQKEDMDLRLRAECHFGKIAKKEVENWLQNVERIESEIKEIEEKVSKRKYLSRASLGKQVEKKIQEVEEVHQKGRSFESLAVDAPNKGVTFLTTALVGESIAKNEILEFLMGDEVKKIGVHGMGGVGKTTIMQHVNNELLEKPSKFDDVIWVTVSQQLDLAKLQSDIATTLKEDLLKEEGEEKRAKILSEMLKRRKKYVLILDDLWEAFPLERVGIPEPSTDNGCKLVITTRSIDVCRFMGCKVVQVKPLSNEEALKLFLDKVGPEVLQIPTLKETVNLVVKQCAGLPLAIVTIAGSMKGVDDVHEWNNALNELCENIKSVKGMDTEVFGRLQFSYDRLKDQKLQSCFLYCALYPEDYKIPRKKLIEYWIDERLVEEMGTRLAMYHRGHAILNRLENNCLLDRIVDEHGEYVKMHDLIRDMALRITSGSPRFMVKAGLQLEELPSEHEWRDVEKASLMMNSIAKIPPDMSPESQTLSTLLLQRNYFLRKIPEPFFAKMVRLEVLDLSYTRIKYLPTSIFDLKNLTALLLEGCNELTHVPDLISKLQALKKLVLRKTGITELPSGVAKLKDLRYLDLRAEYLKEMPAGLLPQLSRLQHLTFITDRYIRYFGMPILGTGTSLVKVKAEEVAQLRKLERFQGNLYDVDQLNMYVNSLPAQKGPNIVYDICVGESSYYFRASYDKCVSIGRCRIDSPVLPTNIQQLILSICDGLSSLSDISSLKDATDLRCCCIADCKEIECVFSLSSSFSYCTTLEELRLWHLNNLRVLIKGGEAAAVSASLPPPATFSHLRRIEVVNCPKMKKLFWPGLLRDLQNLEEILVRWCAQIEEIIGDEEENQKEEGTDGILTFTLPKFRVLILGALPELKSICSRRGVMVCDSLQHIDVFDCPKLKRMPFYLPLLHNGQPSPPPSLKQIDAFPKEWWESVEWDHPNAKDVLLPFLK